jgi:hypothetical protein
MPIWAGGVKAYVGSFLGLAGVACGLTTLFLGMRAVMDVGGACADGGPYEIAQPCPDGVPLMILGGIFGGLIFLVAYVVFSTRLGGRYNEIAAFAWPALFLSLGWNFFEYGIDPPGEEEGAVVGWLVCGVLFALMGGLPLLALLKPSVARAMWWPLETAPAPQREPVPMDSKAKMRAALKIARPSRTPPAGIVDDLERLARLREEGHLSAIEYDKAKRQVLGG